MRRVLMALAFVMLGATGLQAQESDRQLRQRISWAIDRAENTMEEQAAQLAHLWALWDAVNERIVMDSIADLMPPDTADLPDVPIPDPDPVPSPDPDPVLPGDLAFYSDWSAGLGSSQAAMTDGGAWTGELCADIPSLNARQRHGAVVAFDEPGWPTPTAARFLMEDVNSCYMVTRDGLPDINVGETYFSRHYFYLDAETGRQFGNAHYFQWPPYNNWWIIDAGKPVTAGGAFDLRWALGRSGSVQERWPLVELQVRTVYVVESATTRTGSSSQSTRIRITNVQTGEVFTGADFRNDLGVPVEDIPDAFTPGAFSRLELGWNGAGGAGSGLMYIDAVAIRVSQDPDAWIGASN